MRSFLSYGIAVVIGVAVGVLLTLGLSGRLFRSVSSINFSITGPERSAVQIGIEGKEIDFSAILEQLFDDPFLKPAAREWLAENERMFYFSDEQLAIVLRSDLCEPIPEEPLEKRIELAQVCAKKPLAQKLRSMEANRVPPFHYIGVMGRLGIPSDKPNQPRVGAANVCKNRGWLGKRIQIIDAASKRSITVEATGWYRCEGIEKYPDIQISPSAANELFGRSTGKLEDVVLVPLD